MRNKSVFEAKKSAIPIKRRSITLPTDLVVAIDEVQQKLKNVAPNMRFNVDAVCEQALVSAVKKAQRELADMDTPQATIGSFMPTKLQNNS